MKTQKVLIRWILRFRFQNTVFLLFLCFLLLISISSPKASSSVWVRVLPQNNVQQLVIEGSLFQMQSYESGAWSPLVMVPPQSVLGIAPEKNRLHVQLDTTLANPKQIWIYPPKGGGISVEIDQKEFIFEGNLSVISHGERLDLIEELPLESYVQAVLEIEAPHDFPLEALKAQAVLMRSFAIHHPRELRLTSSRRDDCQKIQCPTYLGSRKRLPNTNQRSRTEPAVRDSNRNPLSTIASRDSAKIRLAVETTRGIVLTDKNQIAEVFWHSICGGHTSSFEKVFETESKPYLNGVEDGRSCQEAPGAHWEAVIDTNTLTAILAKHFKVKGVVRSISIDDQESVLEGNLNPESHETQTQLTQGLSGRVFSIRVEAKKKYTIAVKPFVDRVRQTLGPNLLLSNWFRIEKKEDGDFLFKGYGVGDGVGFCQYGAKRMAEEGSNFEEILNHYLPGTTLQKLE